MADLMMASMTLIVALLAAAALAAPAAGIADPACVYCEALGYNCSNGNCTLPDGSSVPAWEFYRGKAGQKYSFCELQGYRIESRTEDMGGWTSEYAVCVFDDCSECGEEEHFDGTCGPSNCSSWTMAEGCRPPFELNGLISMAARINNSVGRAAEDVLGWDVVRRGEDGICRSYYFAQEPLIGMTEPAEVDCPSGLKPFDWYMAGYEEAIASMRSMRCGTAFVNLTLSWPAAPEFGEPVWRITTDIGNEIVVGANCGLSGCRPAEQRTP